MKTDITICNCQELGNFNETTTTMLPESPPARTDTHCSTVSKVRGCAASEGDRKVSKRDQRGNQLSCNREQMQTIRNNSNLLKPPKEPPLRSHTKQNLVSAGGKVASSEDAGQLLAGSEGASGTKLARERVC